MSLLKLDAVIFDFDGTICDSLEVKEEAFGEIYASYGRDISNKVMAFHRNNLGVPRDKKFIHFQKNLLNEDYSKETISILSNRFSVIVKQKVVDAPLIKGALTFLEEFYDTLDIFLSSATPHEELIEITTKKNLSHYFKVISGSPETKASHVENALLFGKYKKEKVVYIGDSYQDLLAAEETGINFLGVGSNNFDKRISTIENLDSLSKVLASL
mgnify:CR=1 FL=1|tara:strand:+ start:16506 stop:17147 length:642 start_codon:yes stop_codon:yes gene_type:complete